MQTETLAEPFIPCPLCGGTLDMINWNETECQNCGKVWNHITHELIVVDQEAEIEKWQAILSAS